MKKGNCKEIEKNVIKITCIYQLYEKECIVYCLSESMKWCISFFTKSGCEIFSSSVFCKQ